MRYLVDGYNLLFALEPILSPFTSKREKFIHLMQTLSNEAGLKVTLIFDTHYREDPSPLPSVKTYKGIEVIYAPSDLSCDEYILEKLMLVQQKALWTVISSDNRLCVKVRALGTLTMSNEAFATLIMKKRKKSRSHEKNSPSCSKSEYERWLSIFEKKK